ncbi:hypothetical protein C1O63_1491 [Dehalococcoides mccartyi]|uniref:hypothetical protein n=1 Tax=Dehalococcoides mccartyi TaxID=61435 RepID=UPI000CDF1481|nr:hypothetical protein [Dehalococcoides mccartyi]POZ58444.1 hypothetical protein C1O63_1491 [Dehalococcoides mccartyi]
MPVYDMQEFKNNREKLDSIVNEATEMIRILAFQEAEEKLQEINELYEHLEKLANPKSNVHQTVLENRASRILSLDNQIQAGLARREAGKREDGNLAFKCNWNDAGYKGICSNEVYNINRRTPRSQCSRSNCREYVGKSPPVNDCCYECEALRIFSFGAGWDHDDSGKPIRPRHIWDARKGKVALLTTIPHFGTERLVVGAFLIGEVKDDPHRETYIYGDRDTALDDILNFSIPFWKFHKNPWKPESQAWGQGLFRYVSDTSVLGILEAYWQGKIDSKGDISKVDRLIQVLKSG